MTDHSPAPLGAPIQPVTPTPGTPKVIVWAFVLALAGFFVVTALAAVAMVLIGWKKVKASGKGRGLAIATLVISGGWLLIMVFALSSSPDNASDSVETQVVDVAAPQEVESVVEEEIVEAETQSFGECIQTPYRSEYLSRASNLSGETGDILRSVAGAESLADIVSVIDQVQKKGTEWDAVGRSFKFADDCGDQKFGEMNAELGDLIIVLGSQLSSLDGMEMVTTGDIGPLEEVNESIKRVTNQVGIVSEYITNK